MDYTTYVEHVRQDEHRLAAATSGSLSKVVPACPAWTVSDLVSHLAQAYGQKIACTALGTPTPVNAELAVDGVDEILVIMLAGDWSEAPVDVATGQRVVISTGERTWHVTLERESMSVTEDGEVGDAIATLVGDPSDVLLWLWGRAPDERVTRSGDEEALRLTRSRLVLATQ